MTEQVGRQFGSPAGLRIQGLNGLLFSVDVSAHTAGTFQPTLKERVSPH